MGRLKAVGICKTMLFLGVVSLTGTSQAIDFTYSGFGNITAGKVFSASGLEVGFPDNNK